MDGVLLPEEVAELEKRLQDEHPTFGDRCNELTLIGLEQDRKAFLEALKDALCSDEEVKAWLEGETFEDPWPKSLRQSDY